jgi:hypothetical protein
MANCNQPLADISEFLREEQAEDQVSKEQNGQNQRNEGDDVGLHGLPQLLACLDVEERQGEENYREQQHRYILHRGSLDSMNGLGKPPLNNDSGSRLV